MLLNKLISSSHICERFKVTNLKITFFFLAKLAWLHKCSRQLFLVGSSGRRISKNRKSLKVLKKNFIALLTVRVKLNSIQLFFEKLSGKNKSLLLFAIT
jgi:hypothetical protein